MNLYFAGTSGRETPPRVGAPYGSYDIIWMFTDQPPQSESLIKVAPTLRRVLIRFPKGTSIEETIKGLQSLMDRLHEIKDAKDTEPMIITVGGGNGG